MSAVSRLVGGISAALIALVAASATADPAAHPRTVAAHAQHRARGEKPEPAESVGPPNAGKLAGAGRLKGSHTLVQREGAHSWGLPVLIRALHRAADRVARKHRGSVLFVGDLSGRTGGYLPGHNSHQSGRDADIGFYVMNSKGKPIAAKRFIAFGGDGRARDLDWARFDDARNWLLAEALLEDREANVHYLFVSNPLKARLLQAGLKAHATKAALERASLAMLSPDHADVHDDHFHVRIGCPSAMRGSCVEESAARGAGASNSSGIGAAARAAGIDPNAPSRGDETTPTPAEAPTEKPDMGMIPGKPSDPPPIGD